MINGEVKEKFTTFIDPNTYYQDTFQMTKLHDKIVSIEKYVNGVKIFAKVGQDGIVSIEPSYDGRCAVWTYDKNGDYSYVFEPDIINYEKVRE